MKKNYFMLVCLVFFMALQANAQNFTIDQLFGKWHFTADVAIASLVHMLRKPFQVQPRGTMPSCSSASLSS